MKKPRVSHVLGENPNAPPVSMEVVPPLNMGAVNKRVMVRGAKKQIRIHILADKSGSFLENDPARVLAQEKFVARMLADPVLADMVLLCVTEMSGHVATSGYKPLADFVPVNIMAGGMSPFATLLEVAIAEDCGHFENLQSECLTIHVPVGDWITGDPMIGAMTKYHEHQKDHAGGVYVFPVCIGHFINTPLANQVSIRYQPYTDPDIAFDEIFDHIFKMISNVSQNADALKNYKSLTMEQLQAKVGA